MDEPTVRPAGSAPGGVRRHLASLPRSLDRLRQRVARAREYAGYERDVALLLAKSALAGVVAWVLAEQVLDAAQPTYAPFVALLVVQSTVYRSLLHSVQYVAAVVVGVLAAGAALPLLGNNPLAFAAMLVVGLLVGRWRRLGSMGVQAPIGGIFAYNALMGPPQQSMLWSIIAMVLLGAGVGLVVNLLLLPPMRYHTADQGVGEVSTAVTTLLGDMAAGLREGKPLSDTAGDWLRRAQALDTTVRKSRQAVEHGAESVSYNPRLLLRRSPAVTFSGYRLMVEALARGSEQVRSIATGVQHIVDAEYEEAGGAFFPAYAEILGLVSDSVRYVGSTGQEARKGLRKAVEECDERCVRLAAEAQRTAGWPTFGGLITDADRLARDLTYAHEQGALRAD